MAFFKRFLQWLWGENNEESPDTPSSSSTSCAPVVRSFSFQLNNGIRVTLTNDDVEEVNADVIAISSDVGLTNDGNAAKSLWRRGGAAYRQSFGRMKRSQTSARGGRVLRCIGGDLHCRHVYHALIAAPFWLESSASWRQRLRECYNAICQRAQEDGVQTLAIVLIGAGKAGGPTKDSVRAALEAFSKLPKNGCLTRLLLVERDERRTREAKDECRQWTSEHPAPPQPAPSQNTPTPPPQPAPSQNPPAPPPQPAPSQNPPTPQPAPSQNPPPPPQPAPSQNPPPPPQPAPSQNTPAPQPVPSQNPPAPPSDVRTGNSGGDGEQRDAPERQEEEVTLEELDAVGGDDREADDVRDPTDVTPLLVRGLGNDVTGVRCRNRGQRERFADL